jgi:hypothetical protein
MIRVPRCCSLAADKHHTLQRQEWRAGVKAAREDYDLILLISAC